MKGRGYLWSLIIVALLMDYFLFGFVFMETEHWLYPVMFYPFIACAGIAVEFLDGLFGGGRVVYILLTLAVLMILTVLCSVKARQKTDRIRKKILVTLLVIHNLVVSFLFLLG